MKSWGGDAFPKDHWIHGVAAKEKARLDAKKGSSSPKGMAAPMPNQGGAGGPAQAGKGMVAAPVTGGLGVKSKKPPTVNKQPQMGAY